jgi:hypothetical protein
MATAARANEAAAVTTHAEEVTTRADEFITTAHDVTTIAHTDGAAINAWRAMKIIKDLIYADKDMIPSLNESIFQVPGIIST